MSIMPMHVFYGVEEGATSLFLHSHLVFGSITPEQLAIVGSTNGVCILYSLSFRRRVCTLLEDKDHRQIVGLGKWITDNNLDCPSTPNLIIWIHFRGSSVNLFKLCGLEAMCEIEAENIKFVHLKLLKQISTLHYGFCKAVADCSNSKFFIPDNEEETNVVRICSVNGGEKCLFLSEKFLNESFLKRQLSRPQNERIENELIKTQNLFCGFVMAMEPMKSILKSSLDDCLFLAFEDSTIALFNIRLKQVIDCIKHPKHQQFVSWAICNKIDTIRELGSERIILAISVMCQSYLIAFNASKEMFEVCCVIRKTRNINCNSMTFLRNSTGQLCVACALNSGSVEIYALTFKSNFNFCVKKLSTIEFHCGNSITVVKWFGKQLTEKKTEDLKNSRQQTMNSESNNNFLFVGCSIGKLAIYSI